MKKQLNEKQEKTIDKMKKNRYDDYIDLRDLAEKRLKWTLVEKEKAISIIKNTELQLMKLEGAIIVLNELLQKKQ